MMLLTSGKNKITGRESKSIATHTHIDAGFRCTATAHRLSKILGIKLKKKTRILFTLNNCNNLYAII